MITSDHHFTRSALDCFTPSLSAASADYCPLCRAKPRAPDLLSY